MGIDITLESLIRLPALLTTPPVPASPGDVRHWHVIFNDYGNRVELTRARGGVITDLQRFAI